MNKAPNPHYEKKIKDYQEEFMKCLSNGTKPNLYQKAKPFKANIDGNNNLTFPVDEVKE